MRSGWSGSSLSSGVAAVPHAVMRCQGAGWRMEAALTSLSAQKTDPRAQIWVRARAVWSAEAPLKPGGKFQLWCFASRQGSTFREGDPLSTDELTQYWLQLHGLGSKAAGVEGGNAVLPSPECALWIPSPTGCTLELFHPLSSLPKQIPPTCQRVLFVSQ